MNGMRNILLTIGALFIFAMSSCIKDDFTYSSSATLTFSTDTVSFGPVFTDLTTPTARLLVFNRNSKGVNISSIKFRDPETPFRFNVDGVSGMSFTDVEIRGNDSIYIFIECYIDADDAAEPRRVADQLQFVTNGVTQDVEVEAWAWNVTRLPAVTLTEDAIFTPERPYIVFDSLVVAPGATLTVEPGTMLLFHDKATMTVRGRLKANGTADSIIQMRGDRLDDVLPDVGYDILAGQWHGITIAAESFGNEISYTDMRSTQQGLVVDSCGDLSKSKLVMTNSWLHNSQGNAFSSKYSAVDAYGCCFSDAAGAVVSLTGGKHNFVQCTIANYYLFSSRFEPNLMLSHCLPEDAAENGEPLMEASFENGIIWGLIGDPISPGDLTGSQVFLRNVLLKADGSDDDNFTNCLWNEDPLFYTIRNDYYFNYRVKEGSPAIGAGNPDYVTPGCLFDMDGIDRLQDGNPTLGAYQFVSGDSFGAGEGIDH